MPVFLTIFDSIANASKSAWDWIGNKAGSAWDWVSDKAGSTWTWLKGAYNSVSDWVTGLFTNETFSIAGWAGALLSWSLNLLAMTIHVMILFIYYPEAILKDFKAFNTMLDTMTAVGISIVSTLTILSFAKNWTSTDKTKWEAILAPLVRLIVSNYLVTNAKDIILMIYGEARNFMFFITTPNYISTEDVFALPKLDDTYFKDMSFISSIPAFIIVLIVMIVIIVFSFILLNQITVRALKIILFIAFAPLPLAFSAFADTQDITLGFIKRMSIIALQGVTMIFALNAAINFSRYLMGIVGTNLPELTNENILYSNAAYIILSLCLMIAALKITEQTTSHLFGY